MTLGMMPLYNSLQFAGRGRKTKVGAKLGDLTDSGIRAKKQPVQVDPAIRQLEADLKRFTKPMHQAEICLARGQRFAKQGRDALALQAYERGLQALSKADCHLGAYKAEVRVGLLEAKIGILSAQGQVEAVDSLRAEVEEIQPRQASARSGGYRRGSWPGW